MRKINFFLPGFYENFFLYLYLADLMKEKTEFFYDNIQIGAVYGCFPSSIWNGGRVILGSCTKQEMEYAIAEYNKRGIAVRYTFTNPLLEKIHILDTYCNLSMQLGANGHNEVLVNSAVLEEFIREVYPEYAVLSSTTKCLREKEQILQELEKEYALVVLDSAWNHTEEIFSMPHKDKIELIVNHYCMDNCPKREEHYREIGRCQLEFSESEFDVCRNINRSFEEIQQNRSFISVQDLYEKYYPAGFCNFKLDGRGFRKRKLIDSLLYFLVKPQYQEKVRVLLEQKVKEV